MQMYARCEQSGARPGSLFLLDSLENRIDDLIERFGGRVQLIYLDPPFSTGDRFEMKQRVGERGYGTGKAPGGRADSILTHDAYSDEMPSDEYYTFMEAALRCAHALLSESGCLYLHVDYRTSARMRLMLDGIFGESNFLNEIIWHYKSGGRAKAHFSRKHDTIFFYRKSKSHFFNVEAVGLPRGKESRNHMKKVTDDSGRTVFSIKSGGKVYTYAEDTPVYPSDVWDDIAHLQQKDPERTGYDTQKPEALLERIIRASSREGDLVADFFSGSGTTSVVAHKLGRQFLALDSSPHALHVLRKRLLKEPASLFEAIGENYELRWNEELLSLAPSLLFQEDQRGGMVCVSLTDYEVSDTDMAELPATTKHLDLVDYWALGRLTDGCFTPHAQAFRFVNAGKLPLSLSIVARDDLALHIVDVFGRQGFVKLT